jgi:superfamily I DNA/RNA helicase|tara:strand:- start:2739 stop:4259 length:1521 start_codon:yes stop_codon:yes gene_type:complete
MTPSKYQTAIYEWVENGTGNAIVKACAGSGKTTTATHSATFMRGNVLFLGFNKKLVVEINNKLSSMGLPNCEAKTFHAEGLKAFTSAKGRAKVDGSKIYYLTKNYTDKTKELGACTPFIQKLVGLAKNQGLGIEGQPSIDDTEAWLGIVKHHDIPLNADVAMGDVIEIAKQVLKDSNSNFTSLDFDDMIYLPLYFDLPFNQYDWLILDEAQDTNVCRKLMLKKLHGGRMIAIGDESQAIYGFTGAENDSMNLIRDMFDCKILPLSVCYRCGKNIIEAAKEYLPEIEAYEGSGDGVIRDESYDSFLDNVHEYNLDLKDGIICRNNSPLVALAFGLIREGIGCRIEGKDIGKNLITLCKKWKVDDLTTFTQRLVTFFDKEFERANRAKMQLLEDKLDTMIILIERCQSLGKNDVGSLRSLIESMFSDSTDKNIPNVVVLSSIHKAKGLEFDRCFILGASQFQPSKYATMDWMKVQERNLSYVAITRAKYEMVNITDVPARKGKEEEER